MIIVIVKEEDVTTGIFHGFASQRQAMTWADEMGVKWSMDKRVSFQISSSEHFERAKGAGK